VLEEREDIIASDDTGLAGEDLWSAMVRFCASGTMVFSKVSLLIERQAL
jgi:hypothetical protein